MRISDWSSDVCSSDLQKGEEGLPPPAIRRHPLVGQPESLRRRGRLPEHVDRHAAARVPVAADAQPLRRQLRDEPAADGEGAVLVEGAVVAEGAEVELQRLRSEEHTSELQSLMRNSYAVFCL